MNFYRTLQIVIVFLGIGHSILTKEEIVFNTDLGKNRILEIMYHGPSGLIEVDKKYKFVDTKNLCMDLNLINIVHTLGLKTFIGTEFFFNVVDGKLLSPQDTSRLLLDRQNAIKVITSYPQLQQELRRLLHDAAQYLDTFTVFMQKKQDALDALPKGFLGKFCAKSPLVQAYGQIYLAIPALFSAYMLYKIAPYYQYFYKTPQDLMKDKTEHDFISQADVEAMAATQAAQDLNNAIWNRDNLLHNIQLLYQATETPEAKNIMNKIPDTVMHEYVQAKGRMNEKDQYFKEQDQKLQNNEVSLVTVSDEWGRSWQHFSDKDAHRYVNRYYPSYQDCKDRFELEKLYSNRAELICYSAAYSFVALVAWNLGCNGFKMYKVHAEGLKLRNALYAINRLIFIAERIEQLCKEYGISTQFLMSSITDSTTSGLLNSLKSYPYNSNKHFFVPSSVTRTFMYEVYEKDMHLAPVLAVIAEVDALYTIADKIVTTQNKHNKFCFINFLDSVKPMINGQNYWNVLVKNAVPNSLSEDRKVILTGPNAGGKSTTIRALLQNIIFAQTFGIAAATEFSLTPFDVVHSFINVSDDILSGKSLFATEIARAHEILTKIKSLPSNLKYFFALDELFTGTNAEDGEMCAYKFIENIANFEHIQFIYATHFNRLKEFGYRNGDCVNYKIDAPVQDEYGQFLRDAKGRLLYPYTLSAGANNISVAKEIAYDAGLF